MVAHIGRLSVFASHKPKLDESFFSVIRPDFLMRKTLDIMRYISYSTIDRIFIGQGMIMTLKEYKSKRMQDPEFAKEYAALQPEMNVVRAMIDARISQKLTQKELAERTGIAQTEISRLENGTRNPSIRLLQRLADGMGMELNISFVPKSNAPSQSAS